MGKRLVFTLFVFLGTVLSAEAQITFGAGGMYIKRQADVTLSNLRIVPAQNTLITDNILTVSNVPVDGHPLGSISRVYKWSRPVTLSGKIAIYMKAGELNGNVFGLLQLASSPTDGTGDFVISGSSTRSAKGMYIADEVTNLTFKQLTAAQANTTLPLRRIEFNGTGVSNRVLLQWSVAGEQNVRRYLVQRSADGQYFEDMGDVPATCNGCSQEMRYGFTDNDPMTGTNYYRLKIEDMDGSAVYSAVIKLVLKRLAAITLSPNPARTQSVIGGLDINRGYQLQVFSADGRMIQRAEIRGASHYRIDTGNWPAGTYEILLQTKDGYCWAERLLRQ